MMFGNAAMRAVSEMFGAGRWRRGTLDAVLDVFAVAAGIGALEEVYDVRFDPEDRVDVAALSEEVGFDEEDDDDDDDGMGESAGYCRHCHGLGVEAALGVSWDGPDTAGLLGAMLVTGWRAAFALAVEGNLEAPHHGQNAAASLPIVAAVDLMHSPAGTKIHADLVAAYDEDGPGDIWANMRIAEASRDLAATLRCGSDRSARLARLLLEAVCTAVFVAEHRMSARAAEDRM